jgi:enoyl-CoA hydratase
MTQTYNTIRLERAGGVAEIVLNRPAQLNALDLDFFREIRAAAEEVDRDNDVRAVLLWAEGRAFSVGLNLREGQSLLPGREAFASDAARNRALYDAIVSFQGSFSAVRKCRKPVIAAVGGLCIGGGLDLVTACDIRLCSADALFSVQETKMAMVADLGTLQRITRITGRGFAREMAFTGRVMPAQRALVAGLVNEVFADKPALLEAARSMAREIAAHSPFVIEGIKRVMDYAEDRTEDEGLDYVAHWNASFFFTSDLNEARQAFLEKREPRFEGR